jgi:Tfp pilus assembly protein PilF
LNEVLAANPLDVDAHLRRIELHHRNGDWEKTRSALSAALAANPTNRAVRVVQVEIELAGGQDVVAFGLAQTLADAHPGDVRLLNRLADAFFDAGATDAAETLNRQARQTAPNDETAWLTLARIHRARGLNRQAVEALETCLQAPVEGAGGRAALMLAEWLTEQGEYAAAEQRLMQAESLGADEARWMAGRIQWLIRQRRIDEALVVIRRAPANPSQRAPLLAAAAEALFLLGCDSCPRRATDLLEELLALDPQHVEARLQLTKGEYLLHNVEKAVEQYRRILSEISPDHPQALNDLAWILAERGAPEALEEALRLSTRGTALFPRDVHLLDTRGCILMKLKRDEEARRELERCIALAAHQPQTAARASLRLAGLLMRTGEDGSRARSAIETARTLDERYHVLTRDERAELEQIAAGRASGTPSFRLPRSW